MGGWATTTYTWRIVFLVEVVLVLIILSLTPRLGRGPHRSTPRLDLVGTVLSASGLGLVVLAVPQSSTWGWVAPKDSPIEPFGSP